MWWEFVIGLLIGCLSGIFLAAVCTVSKRKNPCLDCPVFHDPEADRRACFDCERMTARGRRN